MKKSLTTIEIGDHYIKLLEAKRQRGAPCLTYCDIQPKAPGLGADVHTLLTRMIGVKELALEDILAIVPRRHVFLKLISLPTLASDELEKMIPLQLSHLTPFSRDEIIYNYSVVAKDPAGYTKVLLAVIQKEVVDNLLKILQAANLSCHRVAVTSEGIESWFSVQKKSGRLSYDGRVMLIDIDTQKSEICFFNQDRLDFSRHIQHGMADLNEEAMPSFAEAVGLTLGAHKKESGIEDISSIIIVSSGPQANILKETLTKSYSCPIEIIAPLDGIVRDKRLAVPLFCQEQGASITAGVGFCAYFEEAKINLIPTDVVDRKRAKVQQKVLVKFLAVLMVTLALGGGVLTVDIFRKEAYLKKIEEKSSEIDKQVNKAEGKIEFLEFAKKERQERIFITDAVSELYQIIPDSVSFRALLLNAQGNFEIQAYADTQATINQVQNSLVNSKLFKDVTLQYATKKRRFNEEFMEFKIICNLRVQ